MNKVCIQRKFHAKIALKRGVLKDIIMFLLMTSLVKKCKTGVTRHVFVKHGCPRRQQSETMAKISKSYIFDPAPHPGACDVSEV